MKVFELIELLKGIKGDFDIYLDQPSLGETCSMDGIINMGNDRKTLIFYTESESLTKT